MADLPDITRRAIVPVIAIAAIVFFSVRIVIYGSIRGAITGVKEIVDYPKNSKVETTDDIYNIPDEKLDKEKTSREWPERYITEVESDMINKDLCFLKKYSTCYGGSNSLKLELVCNDGRRKKFSRRVQAPKKPEESTDNMDIYTITVDDKMLYNTEDYKKLVDEILKLDTITVADKVTLFGDTIKYVTKTNLESTLIVESSVFIESLLTLHRLNLELDSHKVKYSITDITLCANKLVAYPTFKIKKQEKEYVIRCNRSDLNLVIQKTAIK